MIQFCAGAEVFPFFTTSRPALGPTEPFVQWYLVLFLLGVRQLASETDHLPTTCAEFKNELRYASTPTFTFIDWCFIKNFTSSYYIRISFTINLDRIFRLKFWSVLQSTSPFPV
jgi:hypothetical protein